MTAAAFWDRIADRYAARPIADMDAYERTLARTAAHLGAGCSVLELGCGTGTTAIRLAPSVRSYVASDLSPRMVELGREKARADGAFNLRFVAADILGAELEGESHDAVLAFNLLHLVPDLGAALARIHALVKPGGVFVSKTTCIRDGGLWMMPVIAVMRLLGRAPRVSALSVAGLERAIREAGFEIVETGTFPASPPARFVVARRI